MKRVLGIFLAITLAATAVWAAGETRYSHDLKYEDNVSTYWGTDLDVQVRWDGTDLDFLAAADNSVIKFGATGNSFDIWFYGSDGDHPIVFDASADDLIFYDGVSIMLGTGSDVELRWDGTDLDMLAAADDSVFKIGNGTNSFDTWIFGNAATDYILWDASAGELDFQGAAYVRTRSIVTAKTANYTVTSADYGTYLSNRGDSDAIVFTLPAPAAGNSGDWVCFLQIADQNMSVTTAAGEQLVVKNNATADTVAFSTAGELIGNAFMAISDGTSWVVLPIAEEAVTMTVTDA